MIFLPDTFSSKYLSILRSLKASLWRAVFYKIREIAHDNDDTVFNVDRMIWLICSGNYYMDNIKIDGRREELIRRIKREIK